MSDNNRSCMDCHFCIIKDFGYSNWTVEGTNVYCAVDAHPVDGFDRFYGEEKELRQAEKCEKFNAGTPVEIDVDYESFHTDDYIIKNYILRRKLGKE